MIKFSVTISSQDVSVLTVGYNLVVLQMWKQDVKPVIDVIIAQIRVLFGLASVTSVYDEEDYVCVPAIKTGFSDW